MIDSVPVVILPIPNDGSGPNFGIGNDRDDPVIGAQEMISGPPSIQYSHALSMPFALRFIEMADIPLYPNQPGDSYLYGLAPYPVVKQGAAQDTQTPDPFSLASLVGGDMGAPPIFTGNTNLFGRC